MATDITRSAKLSGTLAMSREWAVLILRAVSGSFPRPTGLQLLPGMLPNFTTSKQLNNTLLSGMKINMRSLVRRHINLFLMDLIE